MAEKNNRVLSLPFRVYVSPPPFLTPLVSQITQFSSLMRDDFRLLWDTLCTFQNHEVRYIKHREEGATSYILVLNEQSGSGVITKCVVYMVEVWAKWDAD